MKLLLSCLLSTVVFFSGNSVFAQEESIFEIIADDDDFSTLVTAVTTANISSTLSGGNFTLFAPSNEAFGKLPNGVVSKLLDPAWRLHLTDLLLHHAVAGETNSSGLAVGNITTLNGEVFDISSMDPPMINGYINIIEPDIEASNGFVHAVDDVILPSSASLNIVEYAETISMDVNETGMSFNTLLALMNTAGLTETVSTVSPLTIFAPTDEAFAALDPAITTFLTDPQNTGMLVSVLQHHILTFNAYTYLAENDTTVTSAAGDTFVVTVEEGDEVSQIVIDGTSSVTSADVLASNGVIHVIDTVLIPPGIATAINAMLTPDVPITPVEEDAEDTEEATVAVTEEPTEEEATVPPTEEATEAVTEVSTEVEEEVEVEVEEEVVVTEPEPEEEVEVEVEEEVEVTEPEPEEEVEVTEPVEEMPTEEVEVEVNVTTVINVTGAPIAPEVPEVDVTEPEEEEKNIVVVNTKAPETIAPTPSAASSKFLSSMVFSVLGLAIALL